MSDIQSISVSQTTSLAISRSVEIAYERQAQSLRASVVRGVGEQSSQQDQSRGLFDIIDISDEAQQRLLDDLRSAEALADIAQGRSSGFKFTQPQIGSGQLRVDANALSVNERFSFSESYELSFLQETAIEVETDQGSFEIIQSQVVEVSLSSTVDLQRSFDFASLSAGLST